tara:strand:+ start:408 stop:569 length:162 start_codon:yes stop_codon:yes gene_type:complete
MIKMGVVDRGAQLCGAQLQNSTIFWHHFMQGGAAQAAAHTFSCAGPNWQGSEG